MADVQEVVQEVVQKELCKSLRRCRLGGCPCEHPEGRYIDFQIKCLGLAKLDEEKVWNVREMINESTSIDSLLFYLKELLTRLNMIPRIIECKTVSKQGTDAEFMGEREKNELVLLSQYFVSLHEHLMVVEQRIIDRETDGAEEKMRGTSKQVEETNPMRVVHEMAKVEGIIFGGNICVGPRSCGCRFHQEKSM